MKFPAKYLKSKKKNCEKKHICNTWYDIGSCTILGAWQLSFGLPKHFIQLHMSRP